MNEENEQERLSRLVGGEGFDPTQTGDMIANSLRMALGNIDPKHYEQVNEEIMGDESVEATRPRRSLSETNVNAEKILINLFGVYDSMVAIFQSVGIDHELSEELTKNIWAIEKCISDVGGKVDHFVPEDYVSGLVAPDMVANAMRVIETTKKCYRLGEIKNDQISKGGDTISIDFHGTSNDQTVYLAKGTIQAKRGWIGNEAIDYIYKIGGGKMTVKSYVDGKWINQSSNYDIHWELEETDVAQDETQNEKLLDSEVEPIVLKPKTASDSISSEFKKAIKEETSDS